MLLFAGKNTEVCRNFRKQRICKTNHFWPPKEMQSGKGESFLRMIKKPFSKAGTFELGKIKGKSRVGQSR